MSTVRLCAYCGIANIPPDSEYCDAKCEEQDRQDRETMQKDFEYDVYKRAQADDAAAPTKTTLRDVVDADARANAKAWRQRHEDNYSKLVAFVREVSEGDYTVLGYLKTGADALLKEIESAR